MGLPRAGPRIPASGEWALPARWGSNSPSLQSRHRGCAPDRPRLLSWGPGGHGQQGSAKSAPARCHLSSCLPPSPPLLLSPLHLPRLKGPLCFSAPAQLPQVGWRATPVPAGGQCHHHGKQFGKFLTSQTRAGHHRIQHPTPGS